MPGSRNFSYMNILLVSSGNFFSTYGGGQVYVKHLVDELVQQGIYPAIATPGSPEEVPTDYYGCAVHAFAQAAGEAELLTLLKKINPDVVHAHGHKAAFSTACAALGIPCIVTAHHGGIVCPAGALLNHRDEICAVAASQSNCLPCCARSIPLSKPLLPFLRRMPLEAFLRLGRWLRGMRFMYFITPLGTLALSIQDKLVSVETLGKFTTRLIAPSSAIGDALVRNGIPEQKFVIVPHGIPLPLHQPLRPDLGTGSIRFLYVGRISHVKGLHIFLEAFSGLSPECYELHIVGGTVTKPERRYLAQLEKKFASVNTQWHGSRPHEEIMQHIFRCDVVLHPAICLEVFGLTIAEALAVGRPVIASRCGGAEIQIRDGENGFLVPPNDAAAFRRALQRIIENPALVIEMAQHTGQVKSIHEHVDDLLKVYEEVL